MVDQIHNEDSDFVSPTLTSDSHDSDCNLSTTWIDVNSSTETADGKIDPQISFESNEDFIAEDFRVDLKEDSYSFDFIGAASNDERNADNEHSSTATSEENHTQAQHTLHQEQENMSHEYQPFNVSNGEENLHDTTELHHAYVEIVDTHVDTVEGYDWEGILDLRNRMKQQQEQQNQQDVSVLRFVTEFRLYLTDGHLEEPNEEASHALDDAPRYEVVEDESDPTQKNDSVEEENNKHDNFVEFVKNQQTVEHEANTESVTNVNIHDSDCEEFTSLALSPLDVLTNSLMGAKEFYAQLKQHHSCVKLTELIVGGPSVQLGEASIERLACSLTSSGSSLTKLVLIVSAIDLPAMEALGELFRVTSESLKDLHLYASHTTERLVASRSRYKNIPAPCVLGPGISSWVDAWTSHPSKTSLRSLNLSRMDIGDVGAFAVSRLLLTAPNLQVLNLAQDDFFICSSSSSSQLNGTQDSIQPLSFAGTKRLLESLILIEDIKKRSLSTSVPLSCSNLLELDLSGWVLEDNTREYQDGNDERDVDDFYDDYNYTGDDSGEDFEFADFADSGGGNEHSEQSNHTSHNHDTRRKNQRACCIIASMLRVNTSLQKLVLATEESSTNNASVLHAGTHSRGFLSVRSTLAIARALRDHISVANHNNTNIHHPRRSLGSNLRTLTLSTDYTRGMSIQSSDDTSSWAIAERKRAIAKIFLQALKDRPIHQLRLQSLSCTQAFKGIEPIGSASEKKNNSSSDLRDQLEFYLEQNRAINQSLTNIEVFWDYRLSSLNAQDFPDVTNDDKDNEDDDCDFVEATELDESLAETKNNPKYPPPLLILALPFLLAKAGREVAYNDVLFSCTRILATKTNVWKVASEYRCG